MSIQSIFKAAIVCTGLVLTSCGGSSGSGGATSTTPSTSNPTAVSLTGVVVDGYLEGATAFLDLNGNGSLDAGEPSAITKADGSYNLSITAEQAVSGASVVVDVPATAIDADTGKAIGQRFVMSAPPVAQGTLVVVSPMTTLIKSQMDKDASLTVASAEANVKAKIGLTGSNVDLLSDYVAAKNTGTVNAADYERVHSIARVSAQAVKNNIAAVETAANAAGVNTTVNDIVTLIVDQVLAELNNIALQVDMVPASTFDPTTALANTNANTISTATIATDITAIQDAAKKPVITLNGSNQMTVVQNTSFIDPGAAALSNIDGDISSKIQVSNNVDMKTPGFYTITYDVSDAAGNKASQVLRVVSVVAAPDTTAPIITLNGTAVVSINSGTLYIDAGATLDDPYATLTTTGYVNTAKQGTYTITYDAVDGAGNKAVSVTRTVNVVDGTAPAVFQLLGGAVVSVLQGGTFTEPGVFAWDATDGDISNKVVITGGPINTATVGTYTLTYNVSDKAGNAAPTLTRTINVTTETVPPVVTAPKSITKEATGALTAVALGSATVTDNVSTNLTATANPVGPYAVGVHTITWTATDAAGNIGTATQTVTVTDTTAPSITAPANITQPATAALTAIALGTPTGVSDLTSTPTVQNNAPTGGFPVGTTTVTWTAIDAYNNSATATQTVTVTDNVAPVVTAPTSVSLLDTDTAGVSAFLNGATATDNIDGTLTVTNNAPATLPLGTTTVTFSATDSSGNTGTATASVTLTAAGTATNPPVQVTVLSAYDYILQTSGTPIANAVVVVDGVEYPTDTSGIAFVPGLDVGVHDVHVFASGYTWQSIYGFTSDPAGSIFQLDVLYPVSGVPTPTPTPTPNYYADSYLPTLNLNMPIGYTPPTQGVSNLEVSITDPYGNAYVTQAYNAYDPYSVVYSTYSPMNITSVPAFSSFTGTVQVSEVSCDIYGFNCLKTDFSPITQTLATVDGYTASNLGNVTTLNIINQNIAVATPVSNTLSSQVVMDVNFANTLLAPGTADIYAQNTSAHVVFSVTDVYGNITDYQGYVNTTYTSGTAIFDPYTGLYIGQTPSTVATSQVVLDFYDVTSGTALTGNLYVVETSNTWEISNYLDLGVTTLTTTAKPYIYTGFNPAASVTINATFNQPAVLPPITNTVSNSSQVDFTASVLNSIYHDPYTTQPANSSASINLELTTTDVYGNTQIYGGSVYSTGTYDAYGNLVVDPLLSGNIYFWDLPAGTPVTGILTATETLYDYTTGLQSTVQFVDLGLQTFTTTANQQSNYWKAGLYVPQSIVATPVPLSLTFPVTPPTPTTVLAVQSVTTPFPTMVVDYIGISDLYGTYLGASNFQGTLPYTFTSIKAVQGLVQVDVSATDIYTGIYWYVSQQHPVGATVNISSAFATMPTIPANQIGSTITYDFGGLTSPATVGMVAVRDLYSGSGVYWRVFTPPTNTSFNLPPVPLSITNPLVASTIYGLDYEVDILGSYTYSSFGTSYFSNIGGWGFIFQNSFDEYIGSYNGIPYTY